ncbi:ATP-binding protein [Pseudomonas amygdali]|uniref:ATP-binding protein n=1 Tax=Pseudomonas amygdali TaxID=47877 RepID=UPI0011AEF406|nr:ATP-binding protein [Pseudomonas amygdali]
MSDTNQAHSYLMHLGFFDFINIQAGKLVGEATGSQTYLPITVIEKPQDAAKSGDLEAWYESIIQISRSLAGVLAGSHDDSKDLRIYSYSIREIIRNVFEHSGASRCFICGQRWGNGAAEFAVVDEGVGVCTTLRTAYDLKNDEEALITAINPGVSRTAGLTKEENIYDNSGFGLYLLSQLGSNFGWFMLGSAQAKVIGAERKITASASSFEGT